LRTRKDAESFERHSRSQPTSYRLFDRNTQRIDDLLIHIAKELDRQMDRSRLHPGDACVSLHLRLNSTLQFLLHSGKFGPQLLTEFDGKERADHVKLALFMTVRREIAEPRRATGARSLEDLRRTRAVR
jgi:hypothetical protein